MDIIELQPAGDSASGAQLPGIGPWSRRRFLKCMGAVAAGSLASAALARGWSLSGVPLAVFEAAFFGKGHAGHVQSQALAATAQLLQQVVSQLQGQGFPFDLNQHSLVRLPDRPDVIGMLLHDTRIPPYQNGADIALTINVEAPWLSSLQYVIGRSRDDALEIHSTILTIQGQRYEEQLSSARDADHSLAPLAGSERADRQDSPASPGVHVHHHAGHDAAVSAAGPPTIWKESSPWHYDRCCTVAWYLSEGSGQDAIFQLRYDSSSEYRSCRACSHSSYIAYGGWYNETRSVALNWRDSDGSVRPGA